jgi:hypothetical protein
VRWEVYPSAGRAEQTGCDIGHFLVRPVMHAPVTDRSRPLRAGTKSHNP